MLPQSRLFSSSRSPPWFFPKWVSTPNRAISHFPAHTTENQTPIVLSSHADLTALSFSISALRTPLWKSSLWLFFLRFFFLFRNRSLSLNAHLSASHTHATLPTLLLKSSTVFRFHLFCPSHSLQNPPIPLHFQLPKPVRKNPLEALPRPQFLSS